MRALILGIGNLLWADEGFGVRAVEELHPLYEFPANVKLLDGGTQAQPPGSTGRRPDRKGRKRGMKFRAQIACRIGRIHMVRYHCAGSIGLTLRPRRSRGSRTLPHHLP